MDNTGTNNLVAEPTPSLFGSNGTYIWIGLLVAVVAVGAGIFFWFRRNTMPRLEGLADKKKEGFYGGVAKGSGAPDCLRASAEAGQLHELFAEKVSNTEEGPADFREFDMLLSRICCFKKDLLSVAQQVEATRYQPFSTELDLEPIAETTARCFAKTSPPKDIELLIDKWERRGHFLIVRLCTSANLTEGKVLLAEQTFTDLLKDVKNIAVSKCLKEIGRAHV